MKDWYELVSLRWGVSICAYCERWLSMHCDNCSPQLGPSQLIPESNADHVIYRWICRDCLAEMRRAYDAGELANV